MKKDDKFQKLQSQWYERLAHEGFVDIESKKGHLKQYDRRTIAFDNRERIQNFFIQLDHYLTEHFNGPSLHREILTLYSEGKYLRDIAVQVNRCPWTVKQVILKYKKLI